MRHAHAGLMALTCHIRSFRPRSGGPSGATSALAGRKCRRSTEAHISAAVEGNACRPRFGQCLEERPWRDAKVRLPARFARGDPNGLSGRGLRWDGEKILPARCACRSCGVSARCFADPDLEEPWSPKKMP